MIPLPRLGFLGGVFHYTDNLTKTTKWQNTYQLKQAVGGRPPQYAPAQACK